MRRLGAYLATAVGHAGPIELYACCGGDEAEPAAAGRATLTAADFAGDAARFALAERWLATVVPAPS